MYCPNCGKPNDDKSVYCFDCGAKLQQTQNQDEKQNVQPPAETVNVPPAQPPVTGYGTNPYPPTNGGTVQVQMKKPMDKKTKIILGSVFGGFGALIVALVVIMLIFTPERAAEKYIKALVDGDYKKAYSYIYSNEKDYVSEEQYVTYMSNNSSLRSDIVDDFSCINANLSGFYSALNMASTDSVFKCQVNLEINPAAIQNNPDLHISDYVVVNVVKSGGFAYKISIANELVENVTIRTLKGSTVTLDGKQVYMQQNSGDSNSSSKYETYCAAVVLKGVHDLKIEHALYETIENTIYIDNYDTSVSYTQMVLKETIRTQIFNQSTEIFKSMCAAAMSSKDFSAVTGNISSDPNIRNDLTNSYNYFRNRIKNSDGVGYASLNFTSFTDTTSNFSVDNNRYTCNVNYTYDNVYVSKDYRSPTGFSQRENKGAEGYIHMTFEFVGDGWQLVSIRNYKI